MQCHHNLSEHLTRTPKYFFTFICLTFTIVFTVAGVSGVCLVVLVITGNIVTHAGGLVPGASDWPSGHNAGF